MSEIFSLASTDLKKIINHRIDKVALLVENDNYDKKQFFENVATYWGHNVKLFINIDDAKNWLI